MKTIFSHDPGTANYGYGVTQVHQTEDRKMRIRVLENGLCASTIRSLNSLSARKIERDGYVDFLKQIKAKHNPDILCGERFMTRGIKGPTVESVNIMLGALENNIVFWPRMVKMIPAATWKNAVNRSGVDLKAEYKRTRVTPHQLDAVLIGLYIGFQGFGRKDFDGIDLPDIWDSLLDQIELTTTARLINRKVMDRVLPS